MSIHYPAILTSSFLETLDYCCLKTTQWAALRKWDFHFISWGSLKWTKLNLCLEGQVSCRMVDGPGNSPTSSTQPCLALYHSAPEPASQARAAEFTVQQPERLPGSLLVHETSSAHLPTHKIFMSPETLSLLSLEQSGGVCLWRLLHSTTKFASSQLCTLPGQTGLGAWGSSPPCAMYQKDKKQRWPRDRMRPNHEVLGAKVTG